MPPVPAGRPAGRLAVAMLVLSLAACGGGSQSASDLPAGDPATAVDGKTSDVLLDSALDGVTIAITVHEPSRLATGGRYPLILHSHGYGGTRQSARPTGGLLKSLLDQGYGVLSIDQRGHGESGGTIRILDPEKEGVDLLQVLDWAEANLPWLAYREGNLVLGAVGGSYGGGFQHLIYAIDPKRRLDAIAPEITWHDLRYSLASGQDDNVFKSYWGTLLSVGGNVLAGPGSQDAEVNEGLVQGLATGTLPDDKLALLYRHSLASYCNNENPLGRLSRIDALYWQSSRDTLFNLNDAWNNVQCVAAQGGDVRLLVKAPGHDGGGSEQCGQLDKDRSILAWYDEKLKGISGAADYIPDYCFHLGDDGEDGVVSNRFPVGGTRFEVPAQTLLAQTGSPQTASILLTTIGSGGAVLAGIPTATVTVEDPTGLGALDPVIFLALAKRSPGDNQDSLLMGNQVRPVRGYGVQPLDLVGVSARLAEGDELRLVIQASNSTRYPLMGARVGAPVAVSASLGVPLLAGNLPAPPAR
ncbi:MAG: hypothetical protein EPN60_15360 [Nevskiaceae bacterium]|nr:MAG: hypothetical protein EPO48_00770 [Nevskiaceae bacterium]TAM23234.1 MAG: hypothetical protein EPN60_15360 [Nevskiaceae bacterium]